MKLLRNLDDLPSQFQYGAVTIGNFDGVHLGHARIVERLVAQAKQVAGPSVVLTFDPHPVQLLRPDKAPPPLTWTDRKGELLAELGVDAVIAYPTNTELLSMPPEKFFDFIVRQQLRAKAMVEGPNFFFGQNRAGNIEVLQKLCNNANVVLEVVEPMMTENQYISSSRVRDLIQHGKVAQAGKLLTKPYRIRGMVAHGAGRGEKIGFPTANIEAIDTLLPAVGVYAAQAITTEGIWAAAVNIGPNPTFGEHSLKVEAHLLDYNRSLYGEPLEVDFIERLRDIQPFDSVDALKQQLTLDVAKVRTVVKIQG